MSDTEEAPTHEETQEVPENEAKLAMEEAKVRKAERIQQEIAEFEEQRKEEKAKEEEELQQLRERREQRKVERAEEEERLTKLRVEEDIRRRQEERERQARKLEEEQKRKEERERRRKEQEDRLKLCRRPNFVITKKADGGEEERRKKAEQKAEDLQKSKEQLEEEKRAILAQRIQELKLDGLKSDGLIQKAKDLHEKLHKLMGEQYDLEDKFKRQQYDMIELTERARSMNKGRGNRSTMGVKIDESFDRLADKFINAPPKIQICSKYERHTDNRSYGDRMQLFEEFSKPKPPPEIIRHGKGGTSGAEDGEEGGEEEE